MALATGRGITVVSYVHTEGGLAEFDALTPDQRKQAATELKLRWLNHLFRGKAVFAAEEPEADRSRTAGRPGRR